MHDSVASGYGARWTNSHQTRRALTHAGRGVFLWSQTRFSTREGEASALPNFWDPLPTPISIDFRPNSARRPNQSGGTFLFFLTVEHTPAALGAQYQHRQMLLTHIIILIVFYLFIYLFTQSSSTKTIIKVHIHSAIEPDK